MKRLAPLLCALTPFGGACIHVHVHESPEAAAAASLVRAEPGRIAGVVVDAEGNPTAARIAMVGPTGSYSISDPSGRFSFANPGWDELTLHASTTDGCSAVIDGVVSSTVGLELVLEEAARVTLDLEGPEGARCAVLADGVLVENLGLHAGKPVELVLTAGEILVRLYEGEDVLVERLVRLAPGDSREIALAIRS